MPAATTTKPAPTHLSAKIFVLLSVSCFKQMQKTQKLSNLEEVLRKKKEHNLKYKNKIKKATLAYKDFATEVKNQIAGLDDNCNKLTTQMSKHREVNYAISQRR